MAEITVRNHVKFKTGQNYIIKEIIVSKQKKIHYDLLIKENTPKAKPHIKTEYVEC